MTNAGSSSDEQSHDACACASTIYEVDIEPARGTR